MITVISLFHGDDEPALRDALNRFIKKTGDDMNDTRISGKEASAGSIEGAAVTLPFLAETRLVLVENVTEANDAKAMIKNQLPDLFADLPDWARLAFVETGLVDLPDDTQGARNRKKARRRLLKQLINAVEENPRGRVYEFAQPRNPVQWIKKRTKHYGGEIEPPAASLLAERIGENLNLADMELLKLVTFVNGERPISRADVELLTPYTPEANIFHMVDAIGQRNGREALRLLRQLIDDGEPPLRVFGMIQRQYRLLIQMKEQLDGGQSVHGAAQNTGMHSFVAEKVAAQSRHYSLPLLERIYEVMLEVDRSIKTGQQDPQLALETFIARLSR